ncbi:MAG: iron-sulfur cluster assembly scaffold protein [Spirochaetales bacterium]|nr:iron-sulfur cluster assembly scaffold protein [Spirochaetales bacterium]
MTAGSWLYTDKVKEHFTNPRNILDDEDKYDSDGRGEVGNITCGDQMLVVIKVKDNKITDCKWKTYGCASAIASTSMMSEMVIGMGLKEAYHIKPEDIVKSLDGLPEHKIHCSVLGDRALRAAIEDYYRRNGLEDEIEVEPARVVCHCKNITDREIEDFVKNGGKTFEELQEKTEIGTVCGGCVDEVKELLHDYHHIYG